MARFSLRRQVAPEPTKRIPLAWGDYAGRYLIGTIMIVLGAFLIVQATAATLAFALIGSAMHVAGWILQPARGWARAIVVLPSLIACWITVSGPETMAALAVPFLGWLLVRRRPPLTIAVAVLPIAVGIVAAHELSGAATKPVAFLLVLAAVIAGAILARLFALRVRISRFPMNHKGEIDESRGAAP